MNHNHEKVLESSEHTRDVAYMLDERRRAELAKVDNADLSWFHAKVCVVAGIGFFTDAYDLFTISIASTMIAYSMGISDGRLKLGQDLGIKVAAPVGTFVGHLLFGWLADIVGRKRMYGIELMIIIVATFAQALSGSSQTVSLISVLIVWRVILGIGIGGDYPLSAVISSEFASINIRGRMMTITFANQGGGNFTGALLALIITVAYRTSIIEETNPSHPHGVDSAWRLLIGLGCVPAAMALYFRLTISETPRFTMDIEQNLQQASADIQNALNAGRVSHDIVTNAPHLEAPKASWSDFRRHFGKLDNFKVLFATSFSWFALDIVFYGLGLNSGNILQTVAFNKSSTLKDFNMCIQGNCNNMCICNNQCIYDNLWNISVGNLTLSVAGLIPGYWATFFLIDRWGRKPIQLIGFTMLTVIFTIIASAYDKLQMNSPGAFLFLYCLANFFLNFGPNTTTFIIPGETFPTRYRSTAHGISAASGKLGAILGQVGVSLLKDKGCKLDSNWRTIFTIFAPFMLTGFLATLLVPETKNRSLEDLSNENQERFASHGAVREYQEFPQAVD